ncbi:MAG: hypothetical protein ACE5JX_11150 [Acidobacteriota bacterium]
MNTSNAAVTARQRYQHLEPAALIRAIAREVRLACGKRPVDDATVVVARVRGRSHGANGNG